MVASWERPARSRSGSPGRGSRGRDAVGDRRRTRKDMARGGPDREATRDPDRPRRPRRRGRDRAVVAGCGKDAKPWAAIPRADAEGIVGEILRDQCRAGAADHRPAPCRSSPRPAFWPDSLQTCGRLPAARLPPVAMTGGRSAHAWYVALIRTT